MTNAKDIEFLLSTGTIALIIITAISIVKFILPYITKETKKDISDLQDDFRTLVHKMDELIDEMRTVNNYVYENKKEIEKILIKFDFLEKTDNEILSRLALLEQTRKE